jgi:hypothetical protein
MSPLPPAPLATALLLFAAFAPPTTLFASLSPPTLLAFASATASKDTSLCFNISHANHGAETGFASMIGLDFRCCCVGGVDDTETDSEVADAVESRRIGSLSLFAEFIALRSTALQSISLLYGLASVALP